MFVFMGGGPRFTETEARAAVAASKSYSEALRRLGLRAAGGNHATLKKYVARWSIPVDHFDPHHSQRSQLAARSRRTPLSEILVEHSTFSRGHLKQRLYDEGVKARVCEQCGQGEEWRGRRMGLILDHINGVADDHRLENLQIVCPNCAATLETHCGRQNRQHRTCAHCEREFWPRAARQRYCSQECGRHAPCLPGPRPHTRKVERPPYTHLVREIHAMGWEAVGRRYGVSGNAVRKWVQQYEREAAAEVSDA
jgi:hypothetical protein